MCSVVEPALVDLLPLKAVGRGKGGSIRERAQRLASEERGRGVDHDHHRHGDDECEADDQDGGLATLVRGGGRRPRSGVKQPPAGHGRSSRKVP